MEAHDKKPQLPAASEALGPASGFVPEYAWGLTPQARKSLWSDPQAARSLDMTKESLVAAYLGANLNFKSIPLKEFMDSCEKAILLAGLRVTHGHQKNAAALLGIKPTALFEKLRKHGISGRRVKVMGKLEAPQPHSQE